MAFQQPTRHSTQRVPRPELETRDVLDVRAQDREPQESQTWVLFSPATEITATSYLSETEQSIQTQPRSTATGSARPDAGHDHEHDVESAQSSLLSAILDDTVEDDGELDSLDSHLPEFRSLPGVYTTNSQHGTAQQPQQPILPTHDGLGSFRLDQPALDTDAQDRIYQFERFNPRRVQRRRESFDRAQLELDYEQNQVAEKRQRIEAWRLEHSRILLDEVQRETRRRRQSQASQTPLHVSDAVKTPGATERETEAVSEDLTWHDEDAALPDEDGEGIVARFTRKVLKNMLDIDDRLLAILLGEAMPEEEELAATPRASQSLAQTPSAPAKEETWQLQILERVSRELGLLVSQLSQHPGAFSTYTQVQQAPLPYAGLPIIPESSSSLPTAAETGDGEAAHGPSSSFPDFKPTVTIEAPSHPINIPGRRMDQSAEARDEAGWNGTFTKEEWEQDLDVKLVFKYLRSRFTSRWSSQSISGNSHVATNSTQDMAAKAARVRQHHPLTARARPVERRTFKATAPAASPVALRHHSSCASQSTRRSARRSSCSSRHYWDLGGSLGTGSVIAPTGPMGSWGEV